MIQRSTKINRCVCGLTYCRQAVGGYFVLKNQKLLVFGKMRSIWKRKQNKVTIVHSAVNSLDKWLPLCWKEKQSMSWIWAFFWFLCSSRLQPGCKHTQKHNIPKILYYWLSTILEQFIKTQQCTNPSWGAKINTVLAASHMNIQHLYKQAWILQKQHDFFKAGK